METNNKPFSVQAGEGFSVQYKNKLLYSKYNPSRNILNIIQNLELLPDTLILCFSPVLSYGIDELYEKLPENCLMLCCEADKNLFEFCQNPLQDTIAYKNKKLRIVSPDELFELPLNINGYGFFKRTISLDFSAGVNFSKDFYNRLFSSVRDAVAQFWKNRVTLVKFGRKYSLNLFRNIYKLPQSQNLFKTDKPVLVCGAGESLIPVLENIKNEGLSDKFFIIAVDAALSSFRAMHISVDYAVVEEAQAVISGAFTGNKNIVKNYACSVSSLPAVSRINTEKTFFYLTEYSDSAFLKKIENMNLCTCTMPPLGSVGLTAVELALKIRTGDSVPVYICGLDFSYTKGKSHANSSFHDNKRRLNSCRINSLECFGSAFNENSSSFIDQTGKVFYTTPALSMYGNLFNYRYSTQKNLFKLSETGYPLNIKFSDLRDVSFKNGNCCELQENGIIQKEKVIKYLKEELSALSELKDIFTGKIILSENEKSSRIKQLLSEREYLYLHFPDGYRLSLEQNFLNRVRIELDKFQTTLVSTLEKTAATLPHFP